MLLSSALVASSNCLECVKLLYEFSCYIIRDLLKVSITSCTGKGRERKNKTKQKNENPFFGYAEMPEMEF